MPCRYAGETPAVGPFYRLHFTSLWRAVSRRIVLKKAEALLAFKYDAIMFYLYFVRRFSI